MPNQKQKRSKDWADVVNSTTSSVCIYISGTIGMANLICMPNQKQKHFKLLKIQLIQLIPESRRPTAKELNKNS